MPIPPPRTRRLAPVALTAAAMLISAAVPAYGGPAADASTSTITVSDQRIAAPVSERLFGANERWPRGELGVWDVDSGIPDPTMVALAERLGLSVLRFPGGTVANLYRWKRGIGPQAERECQLGGGFVGRQEPMDSIFGPDENGVLADAIGAETVVMTSSVQPLTDAADFVEYMNSAVGTNPNGGVAWAEVRAENGHPEPYDVRTWEIGNELYLGNQSYWRADQDHLDLRLRQYAFGGSQRKIAEPVGTDCDHRPSAAVSDGSADQTFEVHWAPVNPAESSSVMIDGTAWTEVAELSTAGPAERVYTLDDATGVINFGDGTHGAIPPQGSVVTATYTSGPHPGFVDYYREMKQVDPTINICSAWEKPEWVELMGTEHRYDCLAPHLYARPSKLSEPGGEPATPEAIYDAWQDRDGGAHAEAVTGELRELDAALTAVFGPKQNGDDRPFLTVTEWGSIPAPRTGPPPKGMMGNSVGRTIYGADMMGLMINHSVGYAVNSNLNHEGRTLGELFGGSQPHFFWQGRANMLKLYTHLIGSTPVRVQLGNNPEAASGDYDALTSYATRADEGTVWVVVVNHDRLQGVPAQINVDGVAAGSPVIVRTHNGPEIGSYNTPEDQNVISTATRSVPAIEDGLRHTFEPHSVTLLQFDHDR